MASFSASGAPDWRALVREPALARRLGAYGAAVVLHALALALLLMVSPAAYEPLRRAVNAVEVRLYTVAGGAQAETDAPLFEPPIAAQP
ncbi:MAG: hypothetical protein ACLFQ5_05470, partial [Oceanicaulis sp.]